MIGYVIIAGVVCGAAMLWFWVSVNSSPGVVVTFVKYRDADLLELSETEFLVLIIDTISETDSRFDSTSLDELLYLSPKTEFHHKIFPGLTEIWETDYFHTDAGKTRLKELVFSNWPDVDMEGLGWRFADELSISEIKDLL